MDYRLKIDSFEGPLDLLWHLIKTAKMDVFDLNLELITNQYLDYINAMEELNLDIASSYLVMAAELLELKSKLLLPKHEEEPEEEPEINLVDRLLEYQRYKDVVGDFKELEAERKTYYTKYPEPLAEYIEENTQVNFGDVSLDDLVKAFQGLLQDIEERKPLPKKVSKKEITVDEKILEIKEKFADYKKMNKRIKFVQFFEEFTKENLVVTFLAILEMARDGDLSIVQDKNFGEIYCEVN